VNDRADGVYTGIWLCRLVGTWSSISGSTSFSLTKGESPEGKIIDCWKERDLGVIEGVELPIDSLHDCRPSACETAMSSFLFSVVD
jgi:hypothetical protein